MRRFCFVVKKEQKSGSFDHAMTAGVSQEVKNFPDVQESVRLRVHSQHKWKTLNVCCCVAADMAALNTTDEQRLKSPLC